MNSWIAQDVLGIVVLYLPQWKSFVGCCDLQALYWHVLVYLLFLA